MQKYHVAFRDDLDQEFAHIVEVPDLVDNVTEWVREEYDDCRGPELDILFIRLIRPLAGWSV